MIAFFIGFYSFLGYWLTEALGLPANMTRRPMHKLQTQEFEALSAGSGESLYYNV